MSMLLVRSVVIKRGKLEKQWKTTITGGFKGEIHQTKWRIFHCYVWLPEGKLHFLLAMKHNFYDQLRLPAGL